MPRRCWLMKSEPEVFSIDDLARAKRTGWEGVRNFQARNSMRDDMSKDDLVLFYHSSADPSGVAGLAAVDGPPVADPTQFEKKSEFYDATSDKADPRWVMRHIRFVEKFSEVLPLEKLKADPKLAGMPLLQRGQRLSVQPVDPKHFSHVLKLAKAKTTP
ncbi:MAG: EVE domain-containing protein [Archangium sp.]|nr:EVE domain-containing protein [Archangium sp.]